MSNKKTLEEIVSSIHAMVHHGEFAYEKDCLEELLEELDLAKSYAIQEYDEAQEFAGNDFYNSIDDYDWEEMKLSDPNLSDQ